MRGLRGSGALAGVQKRAASLLEAQVRARQRQLKLLEAARGAAATAEAKAAALNRDAGLVAN